MENQKTNKKKLLVERMQAYLDNFSKDNRNKKDRRNYKKTHKKLSIEYISDKVFNALLKKRGYDDMSFKPTTEAGKVFTQIYENSLKQEKNNELEEVR